MRIIFYILMSSLLESSEMTSADQPTSLASLSRLCLFARRASPQALVLRYGDGGGRGRDGSGAFARNGLGGENIVIVVCRAWWR